MKINLIFFISEFNLGGAGNSIFKLCKGLSKNKYDISVICINKCYYKNLLVKNGVKVFEIRSPKTIFAMGKVKNLVKKLNTNYDKNIFVSNIYFTNILSILFLRDLKMKLLLIERTPLQELSIYYGILDFIKKNIFKLLIKLTFFKADLCISNSKFISKEYNQKFNLNFKTIFPPSFSGKIYKNHKNHKKNKLIRFGTVCRLGKEKNLYNLIKFLSKFKNKFIFEIIGDGPEKKKLINLRNDLGLFKEINFLGKIEPNQINKFFKKFDFYINSSDFEGFPNSVVEALSHNIYVIASQSYGGINEIVPNKNFGTIYRNKKEFEEIIRKLLLKQKINKIKKDKLYRHLNRFSEKKNIQKYNAIFNSI